MKISNFNKGIISSSAGSFWWGFLGTYYFQYITFIGTLEVVVHRSLWTFVILVIAISLLKKWSLFKEVFLNKNKIFYLFKSVIILGLIILLQIILGILTVLSGASILVASLHQFSSILLITSSLYFLYKKYNADVISNIELN